MAHATTDPVDTIPSSMSSSWAVLWKAWRDFNALAARYQRTALLSVIYWVLLGPAALVARLAGQRLVRQDAGGWIERGRDDTKVTSLKRQY